MIGQIPVRIAEIESRDDTALTHFVRFKELFPAPRHDPETDRRIETEDSRRKSGKTPVWVSVAEIERTEQQKEGHWYLRKSTGSLAAH